MNPFLIQESAAGAGGRLQAHEDAGDSLQASDDVVVMRALGTRRRPPRAYSDVVIEGTLDMRLAPVHVIHSSVQVRPGAMLIGPSDTSIVSTDSGDIAVHGATVKGGITTQSGHILVADGSRVEGDLRAGPPGLEARQVSDRASIPASIRVERAEVAGTVTGDHIELLDASVRNVTLGDGRLPPEHEARLELGGVVSIKMIHVQSPGVIVRHSDQPGASLILGVEPRYLDLTPPRNLAHLVSGTRLPVPKEAFAWEDWHLAQHQLERLCLPESGRFWKQADPAEWLQWVEHLVSCGRQVGVLFAHWLEHEPRLLLAGVGAQRVGGVERSCAALVMALLQRDPQAGDGTDRAVLKKVAELAKERGARWSEIRHHIDQLEGRTHEGTPLIMPAGQAMAFKAVAPSRRRDAELPRYFAEFRNLLKSLDEPRQSR